MMGSGFREDSWTPWKDPALQGDKLSALSSDPESEDVRDKGPGPS